MQPARRTEARAFIPVRLTEVIAARIDLFAAGMYSSYRSSVKVQGTHSRPHGATGAARMLAARKGSSNGRGNGDGGGAAGVRDRRTLRPAHGRDPIRQAILGRGGASVWVAPAFHKGQGLVGPEQVQAVVERRGKRRPFNDRPRFGETRHLRLTPALGAFSDSRSAIEERELHDEAHAAAPGKDALEPAL